MPLNSFPSTVSKETLELKVREERTKEFDHFFLRKKVEYCCDKFVITIALQLYWYFLVLVHILALPSV